MISINKLKQSLYEGNQISREEALYLYDAPLQELCHAANEIRERFCGNTFDLCAIVNGKSGRCSEDCKFCAQSAHYCTEITEYPLLHVAELAAQAKDHAERGVLRFSVVASGRGLSEDEVDHLTTAFRAMSATSPIALCASLGLLSEEQFRRLKDAGVTRIHNNLETSRRFFPQVCSTHRFEDKVTAIRAAQNAGLVVCSGGIIGLGETFADRIDMALELRDLGILSVPLNLLNPIPGTPFEQNSRIDNDEMRRVVAVFRFIMPQASLRLAGGRGLLPDKGRSCFLSGANAAITGDMLTTAGIDVATDLHLLRELGYEARLQHV